MQTFLEQIVAMLPGGGLYYALIAAVALLESIVLIGLLVPGSTLVVLAGFLAANGKGTPGAIAAAAFTGALLGDMISYLLGSRFGSQLMYSRSFQKHLGSLRKTQLFLSDHGGKSLFFGRFTGPLRGSIPFVAGCTHMPAGVFTRDTLLSCLLWGIVYPALGYLGAASWQKVKILTGRFSLLLVILLVLFIVNGLFWRKLFPRLLKRTAILWPRLANGWAATLQRPFVRALAARFPRLWSFAADRFSLRKGSGLYLTCGFVVSTLFAGLFFWLLENIVVISRFDRQVYDLLGQLHHPLVNRSILWVSSLFDLHALLIFCGLLLLWLILDNRDFSATILLAGMGGGQGLILLAKQLFQRARPQPFFELLQPGSASFPSGHAFNALVLLGLLAYFLLGTLRNWQSRLTMIIAMSFIALIVGFSRCYLGLHWPSDIMAGYLLAAIWLTFLLTTLEIRRNYAGEFPWRSGWQPLRLSPRQRQVIMALASVVALYALIRYLVHQSGLL